MSHVKRDSNFLYVYLVEEILSQEDCIVSSACTHNPKGAKIQLSVKNITENLNGLEIDNSLKALN